MSSEKKIININVVDLVKMLKADKKQLRNYCGVAIVIGLVIAFTTPKTYKSTVMLAPEESGQGFSGSISSLASMVGMNMKIGQTGDALYPEIYPDLVSSTDFIIGLFPIQVSTIDGSVKCDYYTYLTKHKKIALVDYPKLAISWLVNKLKKEESIHNGTSKARGPIWLTKEQDEIVKGIVDDVDCTVDKKTNVITITVKDQDPFIAATMADSVKQHLQAAITDYRTKKARIDLQYMQKLFSEAKQQYDQARRLYASYADANLDVNLQSFKSKENDLENEMQLKYNIYTTLVEQLQLARAKVQERTPAFTVVQSATVPIKHSSRPKIVTLLIWLFLGFMLRFIILFWKNKESFINA